MVITLDVVGIIRDIWDIKVSDDDQIIVVSMKICEVTRIYCMYLINFGDFSICIWRCVCC